jgi:hypothetical protein
LKILATHDSRLLTKKGSAENSLAYFLPKHF